MISISDTGGENNGSTALCCYSFSQSDCAVRSIWSPTAAHHSGIMKKKIIIEALTYFYKIFFSKNIHVYWRSIEWFKLWNTQKVHQKWPEGRKRLKTIITNFYCGTITIWNLILLYIVKVLNSATKVVNYCKSQPMLREVGCAVFPLCWYSTWFDKTKLVSCETSQCLQSHHINNLIRNKKFLNLNIDKNCFVFK